MTRRFELRWIHGRRLEFEIHRRKPLVAKPVLTVLVLLISAGAVSEGGPRLLDTASRHAAAITGVILVSIGVLKVLRPSRRRRRP